MLTSYYFSAWKGEARSAFLHSFVVSKLSVPPLSKVDGQMCTCLCFCMPTHTETQMPVRGCEWMYVCERVSAQTAWSQQLCYRIVIGDLS